MHSDRPLDAVTRAPDHPVDSRFFEEINRGLILWRRHELEAVRHRLPSVGNGGLKVMILWALRNRIEL